MASGVPAPALPPGAVLELLQARVATEGATLAGQVRGVVRMRVSRSDSTEVHTWTINLRDGAGSIWEGDGDSAVEATLELSERTLSDVILGRVSPQAAFMKGFIQVKGNLILAMRLSPLLAKETGRQPDASRSRL